MSIRKMVVTSLVIMTFLLGCNSEGAFDSESVKFAPEEATLIELTVIPSPISLLKGSTRQLGVKAKYDNGRIEDGSDSVVWQIVGDPTIAGVSPRGLLTGDVKGLTELVATKAGITSDTVSVTVFTMADAVIDIVSTTGGKLFTSSPAEAYLNSIGGSPKNDTQEERPPSGPLGNFDYFDWDNANLLCATYNAKSIGGRTNWRLPQRDELKDELFDSFGNMFTARGWPTSQTYWSSTPDIADYYNVYLDDGRIFSDDRGEFMFVSCVSES